MKLWPSESFEIQTSMSADQLAQRLTEYIGPKKFLPLFRESKPFQGKITQDGFKVMRVIDYANSFLPVICGKCVYEESGVKLLISMRIHAFVRAFMSVWFGGVIIANVTLAVLLFSGQSRPHPAMLAAPAALVFGYLLMRFCFSIEAKKAKKLLLAMCQSQTSDPWSWIVGQSSAPAARLSLGSNGEIARETREWARKERGKGLPSRV